ncbi:MAG: 50S ribosomal protein L30 [Microthrixaceae bacterium]
MSQLKVTQTRSAIGCKPKQLGALCALGLCRVGKTHVLEDTPDARGQLDKVPHLVTFEEIS